MSVGPLSPSRCGNFQDVRRWVENREVGRLCTSNHLAASNCLSRATHQPTPRSQGPFDASSHHGDAGPRQKLS